MLDKARLAERIDDALSKRNASEVARKLHVSSGAITHWRNGDRLPGLEKFHALCGELAISADALLGTGQQRAREAPAADPEAKIPQEWIPLVADVAAGEPMLAPREEAEDWYAFKAKWVRAISRKRGTPIERLFAVKVAKGARGESMLPTIRPGASLVVDPGPERAGLSKIDDGAIYVCRPGDGEGWTVKRAWLTDGARYLVLKGDNPDQGAIVEPMKSRELRSVIVGKVVYIGQEEE